MIHILELPMLLHLASNLPPGTGYWRSLCPSSCPFWHRQSPGPFRWLFDQPVLSWTWGWPRMWNHYLFRGRKMIPKMEAPFLWEIWYKVISCFHVGSTKKGPHKTWFGKYVGNYFWGLVGAFFGEATRMDICQGNWSQNRWPGMCG